MAGLRSARCAVDAPDIKSLPSVPSRQPSRSDIPSRSSAQTHPLGLSSPPLRVEPTILSFSNSAFYHPHHLIRRHPSNPSYLILALPPCRPPSHPPPFRSLLPRRSRSRPRRTSSVPTRGLSRLCSFENRASEGGDAHRRTPVPTSYYGARQWPVAGTPPIHYRRPLSYPHAAAPLP